MRGVSDLRLMDRWQSFLRWIRSLVPGAHRSTGADRPREPQAVEGQQPGGSSEDHLGERARARLEHLHVVLVEGLSRFLAWVDEHGRPLAAPLVRLARRTGELFRPAGLDAGEREARPLPYPGPPPRSAEVAAESEPDPEQVAASRERRFKRMAEAGIGIGAVVLALAIVGALVVAFGLRTAGDDDGQELAVGGQPVESGPVVSTIGITRTVANLEITLLRVERLSFGGRVYLRAHNKGEAAAAIPDTEISLRQRGVPSARPAPNRGNRLPRFGSSIQPDEREFSVLFFPRLTQGGAVVTVPWFTRSTELMPEPVQFSFQVK